MPEGPDGKTIIIVKKVSGHGGHHGGAWKVAYADFITAMMALFMVLWLVNAASEPTRQRIASYFRKPGVFQKGSGTPVELGGAGILPDTFAPPAERTAQIELSKKIYEIDASTGQVREYFDASAGEADGAAEESVIQTRDGRKMSVEELVEEIRETMEQIGAEAAALLGEIDIKVDQRGLLIEIMDTERDSMFRLGRAEIVPEAREQLRRIGTVLSELPNPIDIEGHTDARPFRGPIAERYDNWDLSSDRAHAARRALLEAGVRVEQIARVVGYADQRPRDTEDRNSAANRRITISMRFTEQAREVLQGTQTTETAPRPIIAPSEEDQWTEAAAVSAEPSDPEPAAEPEESGPLQVEVRTTVPEGDPLTEAPQAEEAPEPVRPSERDLIFGRENPFFDR